MLNTTWPYGFSNLHEKSPWSVFWTLLSVNDVMLFMVSSRNRRASGRRPFLKAHVTFGCGQAVNGSSKAAEAPAFRTMRSLYSCLEKAGGTANYDTILVHYSVLLVSSLYKYYTLINLHALVQSVLNFRLILKLKHSDLNLRYYFTNILPWNFYKHFKKFKSLLQSKNWNFTLLVHNIMYQYKLLNRVMYIRSCYLPP